MPEYQSWNTAVEDVKEATKKLDEMEQQYKTVGLEIYNRDKIVQPLPFVRVKMYKKLKYDVLDAIRYIVDIKQWGMLKLDKRKFEAHVKSPNVDVDIVEIYQEPRPTLETSKLYKGIEDD